MYSQYHLPLVRPKVAFAPAQSDEEFKVLVAPSVIVGWVAYRHKGFQVQKLLVGVSVAWFAAVNPTVAKWWSLPEVSAPKPLAFWPVPDSLNCNLKPFVP